MKGDVHVSPVGDRVGHYERRDCWCRPVVLLDGVVVHNTADGREFAEQELAHLLTAERATKH